VDDLRAVMTAALGIDDGYESVEVDKVRAAVAAGLARLGLPDEASSIAEAVNDPWLRLQMCVELADFLPESLRDEAIVRALAAGQNDHVQRLLAARSGQLNGDTIIRFAGRLAGEGQVDRALAVARLFPRRGRYGGRGPRAEALGLLAPRLPVEVRRAVMLEALDATRLVGDLYHQASALRAWAEIRTSEGTDESEVVTQALRVVLDSLPTVFDEWQRERTLVLLAPLLPRALLDVGLDIARALNRAGLRATALTRIAARMPAASNATVMAEVLESIKAIEEARELAPVFRDVLPEFTIDQQRYVLQVAMTQNAEAQRELLPHICATLPENLKREAVPGIVLLEDVKARASALVQLAAVLSEAQHSRLLADLVSLEDAREVGEALAQLAETLGEFVAAQAIEIARDLADPVGRAAAFAGLAVRLARMNRLNDALGLVSEIDWELSDTDPVDFGSSLWAQAIRAIADLVRPNRLPTLSSATVRAAKAISRGWVRSQVISAVTLCVDPLVAHELLEEELATVSQADPEEERSTMLVAMAPILPERLLPAALTAACTIASGGFLDSSPRADALGALAKRLRLLSRDSLYPIWRDAVHILARGDRRDLLWDIGALASVTSALSDDDTQRSEFAILHRILRWWP
jgi:hypothetical protein